MTAPLAAVEELTWEVDGRPIVGPLDLIIDSGECVVVIGPNGAGKTTLLRLLAGVLEPTRGRRSWRGRRDSTLSRKERARSIAYVPQVRPARVPLTVEQLVLHGRFPHLSPFGAPGPRDWRAVNEACRKAGVDELRGRPLDELSGGERQAAFIAAALAQEADLLVLDEPTTHLDPRHQRDVARLVSRLAQEPRRAVVTATHDLHFAAMVADRVVALDGGCVLADGPPGEVLTSALLARLFGAEFELAGEGRRRVPLLVLER